MPTYNITTSGNSIEIDDGKIKYSYPKNYFVTQTEGTKVELFSIENRNIKYYLYSDRDTIFIDGKTGWTDGDNLKDALDQALKPSVSVELNTGSQIDAGGRLRVSQLFTQLDLKQINDDQPLLIDRETNGVGASQTYFKSKGGVQMSVSNAGNYCIAQSKQWATYFSGKSQFIEITFNNFQNEQPDNLKRAGYYSSSTLAPFTDNLDGCWLEADGTTYRLKIYKNGTEKLNVPISEWNEYDELNNDWFDPEKFNVLVIQFLYLGGTAVRFGFVNEGMIEWVHTYKHAGLVAETFIESPNQPLRWEIRGNGGAASMDQICGQVSSEGSIGEVGIPVVLESIDYQASAIGNAYLVKAWRLKPEYRNTWVKKIGLSLMPETNDDFIYRLVLNPVYSGAALVFNGVNNSAIEFADGQDATGTPNLITDQEAVIEVGHVKARTNGGTELDTKVNIGSKIDGEADIIALVVEPVQAGLDVYASVTLNQYL